EAMIRRLLGEKVKVPPTSVADATPDQLTTPESYLGYARLDRFANQGARFDVESGYRFPAQIPQDYVAYAGRWTVEPSRIVAGANARLRLRFQANDIYLVLAGSGRVHAFVDGTAIRTVAVSGTPRLYTIARFPTITRGLLELRFSRGLAGYAFTF